MAKHPLRNKSAKGRAPDFILKVKLKEDEHGRRVGAAWQDDDGAISLTLDVGTVLDWSWCKDANVRLFPNDAPAAFKGSRLDDRTTRGRPRGGRSDQEG